MKTSPRTPKYRRQPRVDGQDLAFVELSGRRFYLGRYGSEESREEYRRKIAEWEAAGQRAPVAAVEITVAELADRYLAFAKDHYPSKDGKPHTEIFHLRTAIRSLVDSYASTPAKDFGPRALKAVREVLITRGLSRGTVNEDTCRLKRMFKWAVAEELLPASVYQALDTVEGLRRGRSAARETEKVRPVSPEHVNAIRPFVSSQIWGLVEIQLFTAARAGELVIMRPVDLDTSGQVWIYRPSTHKNEHRDKDRLIYVGPRGQEILRPFLQGRAPGAFLFDPREAEAERRAALHEARKTPLHHGNRPGTNRRRAPRRPPGEHYTTESYRRAITRACTAAGIPPWGTHQLRHAAATNLRREFGIDVARIILGHSSAAITEIYAELDHGKALDVMSRIG